MGDLPLADLCATPWAQPCPACCEDDVHAVLHVAPDHDCGEDVEDGGPWLCLACGAHGTWVLGGIDPDGEPMLVPTWPGDALDEVALMEARRVVGWGPVEVDRV